MTEATGAKQKEKPKSRLKPVRRRLVRKELTAARRGATVNALASTAKQTIIASANAHCSY